MSVSSGLAPQASPPASHAPSPITDMSGPKAPSRRVRMHGYNHSCPSSTALGGTLCSRRHPTERKGVTRPAGRQMSKTVEERERVVVRFAGDSGDGMQLTGDRFTNATALLGNDLATLPDFPAEIRAPAGTVHGVSAFQIQFAASDVATPGDHADVLVAMNPTP